MKQRNEYNVGKKSGEGKLKLEVNKGEREVLRLGLFRFIGRHFRASPIDTAILIVVDYYTMVEGSRLQCSSKCFTLFHPKQVSKHTREFFQIF